MPANHCNCQQWQTSAIYIKGSDIPVANAPASPGTIIQFARSMYYSQRIWLHVTTCHHMSHMLCVNVCNHGSPILLLLVILELFQNCLHWFCTRSPTTDLLTTMDPIVLYCYRSTVWIPIQTHVVARVRTQNADNAHGCRSRHPLIYRACICF